MFCGYQPKKLKDFVQKITKQTRQKKTERPLSGLRHVEAVAGANKKLNHGHSRYNQIEVYVRNTSANLSVISIQRDKRNVRSKCRKITQQT